MTTNQLAAKVISAYSNIDEMANDKIIISIFHNRGVQVTPPLISIIQKCIKFNKGEKYD